MWLSLWVVLAAIEPCYMLYGKWENKKENLKVGWIFFSHKCEKFNNWKLCIHDRMHWIWKIYCRVWDIEKLLFSFTVTNLSERRLMLIECTRVRITWLNALWKFSLLIFLQRSLVLSCNLMKLPHESQKIEKVQQTFFLFSSFISALSAHT